MSNPKVLIIGENSLVGSTLFNYAKDNFELYYTYYNTQISGNSTQIDLVKKSQKIINFLRSTPGHLCVLSQLCLPKRKF